MKYVILGSSGFIGRHLCERLSQDETNEIRLIPRDMYGNPYKLEKYLTAENPDYIINCAAYGNHANQNQEDNLDELYFSNVISPLHLLTATKHIPYKGLILMGSSSEYGRQSEPMKENETPLATDTFYGATKVAQTYLARAFARQFDKPILVVRPFSVYGPGEAEFRFIPTLIRSILTGEHIVVDPSPRHDWIYIDDFVDILLRLIANPESYKQEVVNIGTGDDYTNMQVVRYLEYTANSSVNFEIKGSLRNFDTAESWKADTSLMVHLAGRNTKYHITAGLVRTYEHYKQRA